MIVFLRPHLGSVASGAEAGAGLLYSVTRKLLKLNCLGLSTCLFITVLIKNHSGNVRIKKGPPRADSLCAKVFILSRMSQIKSTPDFKLRSDAFRNELCLKEMTNFTNVGVFGKACRACHYCPSHLLFPPSVYRANRVCPVASASGTAFWVVFEHTSVSSVQKLFRSQEYLWVPFEIFAYYAHTLCFFFSTFKTEVDGLIFL